MDGDELDPIDWPYERRILSSVYTMELTEEYIQQANPKKTGFVSM